MTANDTPTWNNWKGHGRPERFYFWGHSRKAADAQDGRLVVKVDRTNPSFLRYVGADGKEILATGVAGKFWASPAPAPGCIHRCMNGRNCGGCGCPGCGYSVTPAVHTHEEVRHSSDGDAIAVVTCTKTHKCDICDAPEGLTSTIAHEDWCELSDMLPAGQITTEIAGLPADLPPGEYDIQVTGTHADGAKLVVETAFIGPSKAQHTVSKARLKADLAVLDDAAGQAGKPAKKVVSRKLKPCACGCDKKVNGTYAQGHDARHVSKLVAEWAALGISTVPDELLARVGTPALQAKLNNAIARKVSG